MLDAVVGYTARRFRYAMVMPNLASPLVSVASAESYLERIMAATPVDAPDFRPLLTLYCSPKLELADLRQGLENGTITAIKYYPAGATTNSAAGGTSMSAFMDVYELLTEFDARLLVHAEATNPEIDIFDREAAFIEHELVPLCERMPELNVTVEHVSTAAGVDFVIAHPQAVATITPHHLSRDRSDLLANGMKPDLYCKPVINSAADQDRLVAAATSGDPAFFLGTDSAPHPTTAKYGPTAKAGVFNAAYGLEVVADVFERAGAIDRLAAFVSTNGCAAYGVEAPRRQLRLTKTDVDNELATHFTTTAGDEVVLFGTDEASRWSVETLSA